MKYNDVYNEQLVAKQNKGIDLIKQIGLVFAGFVIIAVAFIFVQGFALFIAAAVIWGTVVLIRRFNVEYEYSFTNGDFDIDVIYNRTARKHKLTVDVRNFVVMVKMTHPNLKSELGNITEVKNYGSGLISDSTYAAVYEDQGKRIQLIFDPNEQLFNGIKTYIPRKIKQ